MAFKGLKIDISGDSGSALASLEATKQQLRETGGAADSADDELEELGDQATTTSSQLSGLSTQASLTRGSLSSLVPSRTVSSLSQTVKKAGKLAGALGGVATVATPLISTLGGVGLAAGGLASGFGAVVGSGLIAFGQKRGEQNEERLEQIQARIEQLETLRDETGELTEKQEDELEQLEEQADKTEELTGVTGGLKEAFGELQNEITPLIVDLGEKFIPLIEDAFDAVPTLVERIIDGLGPLDEFKNALRDAGQTILENAKPATEAILDLGRDALPVLRDFAEFVVNNAGPAFNTLVETTKELGPTLVNAGQGVADVIPKLNEFGTTLLNEVIPRVGSFVDSAGEMLGKIRDFADESGLTTFAQNATDAVGKLLGSVRDTEAFQTFKTSVKSDLSAVSDAISQAANGEFKNALGTLTDRATTKLETISGLIAGPDGLIGGAVSSLADFMKNDGQKEIAKGVDSAVGQISDAVTTVRDDLVGPEGKGGLVSSLVTDTKTIIKNTDFGAAWEGFKNTATDAVEGTRTTLLGDDLKSGLLGGLVDGIDSALDSLSADQVETVFNEMDKTVSDAVDGVETTVLGPEGEGGLLKIFDDAFSNVNDFLKSDDAAKIIEEGIVESFETAIGSVADSVSAGEAILTGRNGNDGFIQTFSDKMRELLTDAIPNISGGIGQAIGKAIRMGVQDLIDLTDKSDKSTIGQATRDFLDVVFVSVIEGVKNIDAIVKGLTNALVSGFQGMVQGLTGAEEGEIKKSANDIIGDLQSKMKDAVSNFAEIGNEIISGIKTGIENKVEGLKETILGPINTAIEEVNEILPGEIGVPQIGPFGGQSFDTGPAGKVPGVPKKVNVPEFGPFGGGDVNIPGLPLDTVELAEGGVVTEETLATIGEGGQPEAVVPLDKADEFGGKTVNIDVRVEGGGMDERQLARDLHAEFQAQDL
jgi:gas vesicle protein